MLSVEKLVGHLKMPTTGVAVKRLYDYMQGPSHEMGVTIKIKPQSAAYEFHVFHLHYNTKHKGDDPEISAHFKTGHRKTDPQSFDLPKHDAYGIYVELLLLYPPASTVRLYPVNKQSTNASDQQNVKNVDSEEWVPWGVNRITKARIQKLIGGKNTRLLKTVYVSKFYALSFWDQDAWNLMLDYVTGQA